MIPREILKKIRQIEIRTNRLVSEINTASQEQAEGIRQVNQAIVQMDGVTQQNAALVEEASAAAQAMTEQAKSLTNLISYYREQPQTARAQIDAATRRKSA